MSIQEQLFEGAGSERNYLSWVTKAVAMYCIFSEQCTLSDAADRAQERQMVACCWNHANCMCTLRQWLDLLIIHQLYRCVILAEPSHVICCVTCNKHAALLIYNKLVAPSLTCYLRQLLTCPSLPVLCLLALSQMLLILYLTVISGAPERFYSCGLVARL